MNRFTKWMLKLLLSGFDPERVSRDLYPGKTPPKASPFVPHVRYENVSPEQKSRAELEALYRRYKKSQIGKPIRSKDKGRMDGL